MQRQSRDRAETEQRQSRDRAETEQRQSRDRAERRKLRIYALCVLGVTVLTASAFAGCEAEAPAPPLPHPSLTYDQSFFFEPLGEPVRILKTPYEAYAVLGDGTRVSLPALRERNEAAHRRKYGPRLRGFHEHLVSLAPERPVRAALHFKPSVDWSELGPRLFRRGSPEATAARDDLVAAIAADTALLAAELEADGFEIERVGRDMPVLLVRAPAQKLLALEGARWSMVMGAGGLKPVNRAACNGGDDKVSDACDIDPNVFHHIDTVFNADQSSGGLFQYGVNQRVAIYEMSTLEDPGGSWSTCGIYEEHEAFSLLDVFYSSPPDGCDWPHTTGVASVISGTTSRPCGAALVDIFVANEADYTYFYDYGDWNDPHYVLAPICLPSMTLANYEYINSIGDPDNPLGDPPIAAVNESFGCLHEIIHCDYGWARERDGVTQDYYARYFDHVVVKAAGNNNCPAGDVGAHQEACPFTLNSICVGATDSTLQWPCFSSYKNPGHDPNDGYLPSSDREEPDLMAYGGSGGGTCPKEKACVAGLEDPEQWVGGAGTSFSAPVVTSLVALYRAECEPVYKARFGAEYIRALFRTAAWGGNLEGPAYSTPRQPEMDFKDGAGVIFADALAACPDPGDTTQIVIDLTEGDPMPEGDPIYIDNGSFGSPGETQSFEGAPGAQPMDYTAPPGGNRVAKSLGVWALSPGTRIRATVAWSGCAAEPTGTAPGQVAVDFDLFLFHQTQAAYVWGSQSVGDNNEGFDYTVQPNQGGHYELIVAWPEGSTSCEGSDFEAMGVAVALLQ